MSLVIANTCLVAPTPRYLTVRSDRVFAARQYQEAQFHSNPPQSGTDKPGVTVRGEGRLPDQVSDPRGPTADPLAM